MTDPATQQRIEQWEKMTAEAPDGMSFFSLGNAYKDAERYEEAARAMRKAIEMDPQLSRAYQVLAQILIKTENSDAAIDVLKTGYPIAAERGDVMPKRAMASLLEKLGEPVPETEADEPEEIEITGDQILDRRTGRPGNRMPGPPMKGPVGQFIADHYSQETFQAWIAQGTKVINELRLDFSRPDHRDLYDIHMMEWLGFSKEEAENYAAENPENGD